MNPITQWDQIKSTLISDWFAWPENEEHVAFATTFSQDGTD